MTTKFLSPRDGEKAKIEGNNDVPAWLPYLRIGPAPFASDCLAVSLIGLSSLAGRFSDRDNQKHAALPPRKPMPQEDYHGCYHDQDTR